MALPKLDVPIFSTKLPLTGRQINYRPLLVKEEKIILMAKQSDDPNQMRLCVEQILTNCVSTPEFEPNKLPLADIEFLIIQIRDKSLGGSTEEEFTCTTVNENTGNPCGTPFKATIDFKALEIQRGEAKDKIQLTETVGIKLKPPTFGVIGRISENTKEIFDYEILADTVDFVFDKAETYSFSEQTKEEISEFFDNMKKEHLEAIYDYIGSMPKYVISVKHTCKNCGFNHDIKVDDLANFFL